MFADIGQIIITDCLIILLNDGVSLLPDLSLLISEFVDELFGCSDEATTLGSDIALAVVALQVASTEYLS